MAPLVHLSNVPAIMYSINTTFHATGGITHAGTIKTSHPWRGDAIARYLLRHTIATGPKQRYPIYQDWENASLSAIFFRWVGRTCLRLYQGGVTCFQNLTNLWGSYVQSWPEPSPAYPIMAVWESWFISTRRSQSRSSTMEVSHGGFLKLMKDNLEYLSIQAPSGAHFLLLPFKLWIGRNAILLRREIRLCHR